MVATAAARHRVSVVSPQDRGLPVADAHSEEPMPELGISPAELERRARANTFEWLPTQFDEQASAFYGHYSVREQRFESPQTANLIGPWQLLAAYDRYHDEALLTLAQRAAEWFFSRFVVTHPMRVTVGGVRDAVRTHELWSKYSAEFVILNVGLYRRTHEPEYLSRALQSGQFLIQLMWHDFAIRYNEMTTEWEHRGWRAFGRDIEAYLELEQVTGDHTWEERAVRTGQFALTLQANDGCFYLMDDEYFSTDLTADPLRALILLWHRTGEEQYLRSARRFADWLLGRQRDDGSWPLTIDRHGETVVATAGPGDMPNIAMALLQLHEATGDDGYRAAAMRAFRFGLGVQILPGSGDRHAQDPRARWGFWSWWPRYDDTVSPDQSTHHVRGMFFVLDWVAHVKPEPLGVLRG